MYIAARGGDHERPDIVLRRTSGETLIACKMDCTYDSCIERVISRALALRHHSGSANAKYRHV